MNDHSYHEGGEGWGAITSRVYYKRVYTISHEGKGPPCLVTFYEKPGFLRTIFKPDPYRNESPAGIHKRHRIGRWLEFDRCVVQTPVHTSEKSVTLTKSSKHQ